jgi:Protein of unknown function (Gmx_para_CXXCG)
MLRGEFDSEYDTEMLEADPVNLGEAPRCERCGEFVGMRPWLPPHRAELTLHGSVWGDFAFRGVVGEDFLMSERAEKLYKDAGLSGLSGFEPVEIARVRSSKDPPPMYVHVDVARSDAAVDEERGSVRRSGAVRCPRCRSDGVDAVDGFILDADTWTDEDVFVARGLPGIAIASRRFRQVVEDHGLTNVRFTPTELYNWDSMAPTSASR